MKGPSWYRLALLAAAVTVPAVVDSQEIPSPLGVATAHATAPVALAAPAEQLGPVLVQAGVTRAELAPAQTLNANVQGFGRRDRNVRWMIVGGAMFVVGAVIGGDAGTILVVGGAVIGGVGLYRYLQ